MVIQLVLQSTKFKYGYKPDHRELFNAPRAQYAIKQTYIYIPCLLHSSWIAPLSSAATNACSNCMQLGFSSFCSQRANIFLTHAFKSLGLSCCIIFSSVSSNPRQSPTSYHSTTLSNSKSARDGSIKDKTKKYNSPSPQVPVCILWCHNRHLFILEVGTNTDFNEVFIISPIAGYKKFNIMVKVINTSIKSN